MANHDSESNETTSRTRRLSPNEKIDELTDEEVIDTLTRTLVAEQFMHSGYLSKIERYLKYGDNADLKDIIMEFTEEYELKKQLDSAEGSDIPKIIFEYFNENDRSIAEARRDLKGLSRDPGVPSAKICNERIRYLIET